MIYINKDTSNTILTRFFDRRQRSDTYFIWTVTNSFSGIEKSFILSDDSNRPCSYNQFSFIHHTGDCTQLAGYVEQDYLDFGYTIDTNGLIICLPNGHNDYVVQETTEFSLDPQYIIGEIERDIMFVELDREDNSGTIIGNIYD